MGIISWIILAGFIGSKIVDSQGQGFWLNIALGIAGALIGGFLFGLFGASGVTGLNIYSMIVAIVGSVVVLLIYNAAIGFACCCRSVRSACRSDLICRISDWISPKTEISCSSLSGTANLKRLLDLKRLRHARAVAGHISDSSKTGRRTEGPTDIDVNKRSGLWLSLGAMKIVSFCIRLRCPKTLCFI